MPAVHRTGAHIARAVLVVGGDVDEPLVGFGAVEADEAIDTAARRRRTPVSDHPAAAQLRAVGEAGPRPVRVRRDSRARRLFGPRRAAVVSSGSSPPTRCPSRSGSPRSSRLEPAITIAGLRGPPRRSARSVFAARYCDSIVASVAAVVADVAARCRVTRHPRVGLSRSRLTGCQHRRASPSVRFASP